MYNTYQDIYGYDNEVCGFDERGAGLGGEYEIEPCHNTYDNIQCWGNKAYGIAIGKIMDCNLINSISKENGSFGLYIYNAANIDVQDCNIFDNAKKLLVELSSNINFTNVIVDGEVYNP